ncbi:hypothetical protein N9L76_02895 [bacterium]|nr:hypothetical protein [bacterium]
MAPSETLRKRLLRRVLIAALLVGVAIDKCRAQTTSSPQTIAPNSSYSFSMFSASGCLTR